MCDNGEFTAGKLLAYLGLKQFKQTQEDLLATIQSLAVQLNFPSQVKLQIWSLHQLTSQLETFNQLSLLLKDKKTYSKKKVLLVLELEDNAMISKRSH